MNQLKILSISNALLREQIEKLHKEKAQLKLRLENFSDSEESEYEKPNPVPTSQTQKDTRIYSRTAGDYLEPGRKRFRRPATDIQRKFKCPYAPCDKAYGYFERFL